MEKGNCRKSSSLKFFVWGNRKEDVTVNECYCQFRFRTSLFKNRVFFS